MDQLRHKSHKHKQPDGLERPEREHEPGRNQYGKLSEDVSRVLRNIVLTLLVIAILSQWILRSDVVRQHVTNAEKLEGTPFRQGAELCIADGSVV